jgi:lipoate-protein ligase A
VTGAAGDGWSIERRVDTARALHGSWPAPRARAHRAVGLCTVVGNPAVVLGSTQKTDVVAIEHATRDDVDVVRRSSGGGAVWVAPAAQVWLDVWIPRQDALWDDDVVRSSWWLGEVWVRALEGLGTPPLSVHRGRATRTDWSDVVCFAGVGPGEVTVGTAKLVGMAQHRSRLGAHLHSMAMVSWDPAALLALLSPTARRNPAGVGVEATLRHVATGLRAVLTSAPRSSAPALITTVEDALVRALP